MIVLSFPRVTRSILPAEDEVADRPTPFAGDVANPVHATPEITTVETTLEIQIMAVFIFFFIFPQRLFLILCIIVGQKKL